MYLGVSLKTLSFVSIKVCGPAMSEPQVYFSRSAPSEADGGQLIFCDHVLESSITSRSSVLSCLAEAVGEAKLSDSVAHSEFKMWLAAVRDSKAGFQSQTFSKMCNVIKVADAIDDKHIDGWVRHAAAKFVQSALSSNSQEIKCDTTEGLSYLTHDLLRRLLEAAALHPRHIDRLLTFYPAHHHAFVLAEIITPDKLLQTPLSETASPTFKALASLPASPPSVLSLHVRHQQRNLPQGGDWPQIYARLAQALHHHTGLTSLMLPAQAITATSHKLLFPAITTLTALRCLHLEGPYTVPEGKVPGLKQTIQTLPHLDDLSLHLSEARLLSTKRQREAEAPAPAAFCLADMLSTVTALTSLSLRTSRPARVPRTDYFTAASPVILPHLVRLTALFDVDFHLAASFFAHLSAPLTSLHLAEGLQHPQRVYPIEGPPTRMLLHRLAAFTQLRCFSAVLPSDKPRWSAVYAYITEALPTTIETFHHLQDFTLAAEPDIANRAVQVLAETAMALTRLRLGFYRPRQCLFEFGGELDTVAWQEFFHALTAFQLQHLDLDWEIDAAAGHGMVALTPLSQLTGLRLKGWKCLNSPADSQALAAMTRLQHLCLDHTSDEFELRADSIAALRALSALTCLTLKTSDAAYPPVLQLEELLPPQALPALQQLEVALWEPFDAAIVLARYATALPTLTHLMVHMYPLPCVKEEYGSDEDEDESDQCAELLWCASEAEACLKEAAANAGVALSIECEWVRARL